MQEAKEITAVTTSGETKKTELQFPKNFDWGKLQDAEPSANIAPKYLEFDEKGFKIRCQFLGIDNIEVKDRESGELKPLKTAFFINQDGHFMNAGTSIVGDLEKFCLPGTFIEIEYMGEKKTSSGNKMKEFAIYPLTLKK